TEYYFVVTAVNGVGQSSPSSPVVNATPAAVPGAPTSPSATGGDSSATVSWTAPADDGGSPITGYDIYASTTNPPSTSGTPSAIAGPDDTSAQVAGLTNGTEYYFVVTAVNGVGQSSPSSPVVNATPAAVPGAPTSPSASGGISSATVSWTAPADDGGSPITGYDVYASTTNPPSTSGTPSATAGPGATSVQVTGLTNGTEYYFVVTAVNGVGQSSPSSPVVNATPATTVPSAPQSVSLSRHGKKITVTWVAPSSNGGSPITGYDIYASTTNPPSTSGTPSATAGPSATSVILKKLKSKNTYYVVVVAVNSVGSSPPSSVASTRDSTNTTLSCVPKTVGLDSITTCSATVSDVTVPANTPSGTVSFAASGSGAFSSSACTLSGGTCSVTYTPSARGVHTITAIAQANSQQRTSTGSFRVIVTS
ncbi:MAG TPA: fibronectin type III domain-containing protein, partial [Acidimicrobiales bacterium]|nr:fibronectin type III domain-containing protein [Acidimicrobiales bacterium]